MIQATNIKLQGQLANTACPGEHRYFVAECVGIESEGTVHVLVVCTACGDFKDHVVRVGPGAIRLLQEEKR